MDDHLGAPFALFKIRGIRENQLQGAARALAYGC